MKKNILLLLSVLLISFACQQNKETANDDSSWADTVSTKQIDAEKTQSSDTKFDINSIELAENFDGSFPYFKLPDGYMFTDPNKYHGKGEIKDVDMEYFYNHGIYFPMEGKSFKGQIRVDDEKFPDKKFSTLEVQKGFDQLIAGVGGQKINNGEPVKSGEKDRLKGIDPNAYVNGYLHSCNNYDNVHTYVIRTTDKAVFVQYNVGSEQANITVLEYQANEKDMSITPAVEDKKP
ncbi:MAG: hypothetical protein WKF87_10035 [Chryseolinea sp.]